MIPQIDDQLTEDQIYDLGQQFVFELKALDAGRSEIVDDYTQWVKNYEGDVKPAESEKPWEGASEAHIPKTSTDVDIAYARFMNAVFGQFPRFMLRPLSANWVEFSQETQKFSEWVEDTQIPLYRLLGQAFMTLAKFGTVILYTPFENRLVKFHDFNAETSEFTPYPMDIYRRPNPMVIHPKDFVIPINATDPQTAPWCGYKYKLRLPDLRLWKTTGFFRENAADELETYFSGQNKEGEPQTRIPVGQNQVDTVQKAREDAAGLTRPKTSDEVDMVHIFARLDIDGDGTEEEINFHLHPLSGQIARITFTHYKNRRRPFVDLHFLRRDGIFYSIGIPEMLTDIQRNIDVTFRQIQDNNTFKNTQTIKAKEGGSITPNEKWHPARIWFVREMDEFEVFRMGDSSFNTSMSDLETLMSAGDKRTGLPDSAAGVSEGDRVTATATLALLQEASRRIDLVIGGVRDGLAEFWTQVLELYAQFAPVQQFPYKEPSVEIAEDTDFSASEPDVPVMMTWHYQGNEEFRKRVMVKPTVSTAALNKSVLRQETQALLEQLIGYNRSQMELLNLFLSAVDPHLKMFIRQSMDAEQTVMERIAETFEFSKDSKTFLPKPGGILDKINALQLPLPPSGGPGGAQPGGSMGTPQGLLPNPGAGFAPQTAPGRPSPEVGQPRNAGNPPGSQGAP